MAVVRKVTPFLWFDHNAEEAVAFYTAVFPDSRTGDVVRYGEGAPFPAGTVMTIEFVLAGQHFTALNGGPVYAFTPAVSFAVACDSQPEIDHYWERLSEGGEKLPCGWLTDRFGLTWQVVPAALLRMLKDPDPAKTSRTVAAMLKMGKLDLAALESAYAGM